MMFSTPTDLAHPLKETMIKQNPVQPSQDKLKTQQEIDKIINLTKPFPMTERMATKIYQVYGSKSTQYLMENPYLLARDVAGIGEKTVHQIALIIEAKFDKQFPATIHFQRGHGKYCYRGPGNGKLSPQQLKELKRKLQHPPCIVLPIALDTFNNPNYWTVTDLKRAVAFWFDVRWAHISSYYDLFKKCGLVYSRQVKGYIPDPK